MHVDDVAGRIPPGAARVNCYNPRSVPQFDFSDFVRRLLCIFLMLLVPLHAFALQGGWHSDGASFDIAHEIDHLVGASHHHDDHHGSVHYDESGASDKHFAEHSASHQCAGLPPAFEPPFPAAPLRFAALDTAHFIPNPVPERLRRPPRSLA